WPVVESDQYDTIAGWLLDALDAVPRIGDELVVDGYRFKVRAMRRRRIQGLNIKRLEPADPHEAADDGR
ncbi:MAG: HlyC/CorC family transporter, partial [Eggerthellaceae bacterium]|nr:HlyC/CorC family transporter [Eggerthellaceae bacterium]